MADSNQNSVTNNVTVEGDKVIKFINPFKNHQQHQLDDFSLFLSVSKKCRCCFSKFIDDSDQHTVESWHRQAFLALTGVEMITPDSENFLCLKCSDIMKIYSELGKSAANLQRKYNILMQDLASDIKTEKEEIDEISGRLQDCSDIVISDDESVSENKQPQQTNSSDTIQNRIHDEDVNKCSVRVTRIDPDTIDNYEHCSMVEGTEEQMIDQTLSTTAKSKRTNTKGSEIACLKIKIQENIKCHVCGKNRKNMSGLKRHIRDHHNTPRPSCDLCGKSLARKDGLLRHMQTYHMNIKFSCNVCSAEFQSSAKLLDHKRTVHYHKSFRCEDCDAAFGKPCLLSEHIKTMHDGKRWYCHYQDCSSSFSLKCFAKQHFQKIHSMQNEKLINKYLKTEKNDESIIKCKICGVIAKTLQALYEHFRKTHSNTMRFSCDLCGQTFSNQQKKELIDHMYQHQIQMKVKFSCKLCSVEFQSNLKLIHHEKNAHNKKFKCEKCDASFVQLPRLKEHVKVKHEGKRYNCSYPGCSRTYSLINTARNHLQDAHKLRGEEYRKYRAKFNPRVESEKEDDFKCEICGKIFKNRPTMLSHISRAHNKKKICDFCRKTFSSKIYLIDHMQTHHMDLKLECDLCSIEFRSDNKLKAHKKLTHNKNFKCNKCNLSFGFTSLLKDHVKVKHEGKRYHCSYPECSISLTRKSDAAKHLIVAHSLVGENFIKFKEKLTIK